MMIYMNISKIQIKKQIENHILFEIKIRQM